MKIRPIQYAVFDSESKKVVQSHPLTESGRLKCEWFVKAVNAGNPAQPNKLVTLYMSEDDYESK
ncbi:MAG: hypothetical protein ACTHKB_11505 [Burkholderiaceae bacterium]